MQQAVFAAIAAVVLMTGCPARNERPTARPAPVPTALPKDAVPVKGPPDALRARLEGAYTLGVDRRFLRAFDEVQRMARGAACAEQTAATRVEKGWTIAVCGESVGTLPMDPDFPDAIALLDAYASRIGRAHAVTGPARPVLPLLTADEALARVARLARPAAQGSRADVHVLAASLATLAFELPDRMEIADALAARALAAVVIDRTLGGFETAREEAMVAYALGYERAARSIAPRLAPGDAFRAFLDRDDAALERLAGGRAATAIQLLWLRRLAGVDLDRAASFRPARRDAPLQLALVRTDIASFDVMASAGSDLVAVVLTAGGRGPGLWRWNGGPSLEQLQRVLERVGPDEATFLRACFFDGVHVQARFSLDQRSVPAEGAELLEALGEAAPGTAEDGLQRWLALRVAAARGENNAGAALEGIGKLPGLGGSALGELYDELSRQVEHGDPALTTGVRRLAASLDGRPTHRLWLAHYVNQSAQDPRLREDSLRRAARLSGDPRTNIWVAKLDGDLDALRAFARDERLFPGERALAVWFLAEEKVDDGEIERLYRSLLSAHRDDWSERDRLIRFLEERKRYADAEVMVREWIAARHLPRGLGPAVARSTLARILSKQGRNEEALEAVRPAVQSWMLEGMKRGGMVLAALGREAPARQIAESAEARYPGVRGSAARAAVLWRLGDREGAATVLAPHSRARILEWHSQIAPAFLEVLEDDPAGALESFEALRRSGIPAFPLLEIADAVHGSGRDALAFDMASRLREQDLGEVDLALTTYTFLDVAKGRAAARAWLDQRIPAALRPPLSMIAFGHARDEILWDLARPPEGDSETDQFVWLMFAATSLRTPPTPEQSSALAARFSRVGDGFYHHLGRFLLGYEGPEQTLRMASSGKRACEASYYIGFKADRQGDLATAADWYRASVENGTPRDGEYRWASDRLAIWSNSNRSMARLADAARHAGR